MSNTKRVLRPATYSNGVKSISDDDICADCRHCDYQPGGTSGCELLWPGLEDDSGYVQECDKFENPHTTTNGAAVTFLAEHLPYGHSGRSMPTRTVATRSKPSSARKPGFR